MAYSRAFFEFQLVFAQRLATRFQFPLPEALYHYTTFTVSFGATDWAKYLAGLQQAVDPVDWTYQWYLNHRDPDVTPDATLFYDSPLFGCFYYTLKRQGTVARPHFLQNDQPGLRPLGRERLAVRQAELRRMFVFIQHHEPQAAIVLGNSWLYNLPAYRRIYPPVYTARLPILAEDEFQYLSLWGQCFDRNWQPQLAVTTKVLQRLDNLDELSNLRDCFPYQIRRPQCPIDVFYQHFQINKEPMTNDQSITTQHP
ncbi:MAG: hypothetical protein R3C14_01030 [Caldilineaceae bacterium]